MIEFDFLDQLKALSPDRQERFGRVITRLLNGEVLSPGDNPLAGPDPDWRFLERHLHIVDGYLRVGGWQVDFRPAFRVARAINSAGSHRVRFNLLESLIACILRLVYHEQMAGGSRETNCEITAGDLRERIAVAQRSSVPQTRKNIASAVRRLRKFGLVDVEWGFSAEDEELIVVNPLIEAVLSVDEIKSFFDRYASGRIGEAEVEATDDVGEDELEVETSDV